MPHPEDRTLQHWVLGALFALFTLVGGYAWTSMDARVTTNDQQHSALRERVATNEARFDEIRRRLERIEAKLDRIGGGP